MIPERIIFVSLGITLFYCIITNEAVMSNLHYRQCEEYCKVLVSSEREREMNKDWEGRTTKRKRRGEEGKMKIMEKKGECRKM